MSKASHTLQIATETNVMYMTQHLIQRKLTRANINFTKHVKSI